MKTFRRTPSLSIPFIQHIRRPFQSRTDESPMLVARPSTTQSTRRISWRPLASMLDDIISLCEHQTNIRNRWDTRSWRHIKGGMRMVTTSPVSRRSVLKSSAAFAGAAALGLRPRRARAQDKTLRVLLAGDPFYYAIEGLADQFQQASGIKLQIEAISLEALQARLTSSFISNEPDADVISVDQMWLGQYLESKWILPLNKFIKADKDTDIADYVPQALYSMNTWRGQVGTLPVATYGQTVLYYKDYVEQAGVKIPTDGSWSWADYLGIVEKLNGKEFSGNKMAGTVVSGQQPAPVVHMFTQLAASMGTHWFKSFPTGKWDFEPTIDSPETLEALKTFLALYKNSPPESVGYNWFDAGMRFAKGNIGIF